MKNTPGIFIFSIAFALVGFLLSNAILERNNYEDTIWVKGLGKKDFTSDLIVWSGSFSRVNVQLQNAYQQLDNDRTILKDYLQSQGIDVSSIVFKAVDINKEYDYSYDLKGNSRRTFVGYRLRQEVKIESKEVDKIETLSRQVTDLINKGLEFTSNPPQYYYTQLADLKLEMIAAATEDARLRAEQIAENADASLGNLKKARMGVFQITGQNSNEDYSWGGSYNTWSKKKTASITMTLEYEVD